MTGCQKKSGCIKQTDFWRQTMESKNTIQAVIFHNDCLYFYTVQPANKRDYNKLNYNKPDYNKLDYNKLDYNKLDYIEEKQDSFEDGSIIPEHNKKHARRTFYR